MRFAFRIYLMATAALAIRCASDGGATGWVPDLEQAKWDELEAAADTVRLGDPFDLRVGGSVHIAGERLWIVFADVPSDSRCPINVNCVWEGVASVHLWARQDPPTGAPGVPALLVVHTTDALAHSRSVEFGAHTVALSALLPHPVAVEDDAGATPPWRVKAPELRDYAATLTVTRTDSRGAD